MKKTKESTDTSVHDPREGLERLLDGNRRFVEGRLQHPRRDAARRALLSGGQRPFAASDPGRDQTGRHDTVASVVYLMSAAALLVLAIVSVFTGFKVRFFPFKLCPFLFGTPPF